MQKETMETMPQNWIEYDGLLFPVDSNVTPLFAIENFFSFKGISTSSGFFGFCLFSSSSPVQSREITSTLQREAGYRVFDNTRQVTKNFLKEKKKKAIMTAKEVIEAFGIQSAFFAHKESLRQEALFKETLVQHGIESTFAMKSLRFQNELFSIFHQLRPANEGYNRIHQARVDNLSKQALKKSIEKVNFPVPIQPELPWILTLTERELYMTFLKAGISSAFSAYFVNVTLDYLRSENFRIQKGKVWASVQALDLRGGFDPVAATADYVLSKITDILDGKKKEKEKQESQESIGYRNKNDMFSLLTTTTSKWFFCFLGILVFLGYKNPKLPGEILDALPIELPFQRKKLSFLERVTRGLYWFCDFTTPRPYLVITLSGAVILLYFSPRLRTTSKDSIVEVSSLAFEFARQNFNSFEKFSKETIAGMLKQSGETQTKNAEMTKKIEQKLDQAQSRFNRCKDELHQENVANVLNTQTLNQCKAQLADFYYHSQNGLQKPAEVKTPQKFPLELSPYDEFPKMTIGKGLKENVLAVEAPTPSIESIKQEINSFFPTHDVAKK